jgi:parvulin-like peptidyl-prolyl isomerase
MLQRRRAEDRSAARLDLADLVHAVVTHPGNAAMDPLNLKADLNVPSPVAPSGNAAGSGQGPSQRWLRRPALHFVIIGAALFGGHALRARVASRSVNVERAPIVISAARIRVMQADFIQRWRKPPTAEQATALIEQTIEEELLYHEARVLALDFGDRSVQRRLLEKMRVVSAQPARSQEELVREARTLGLDDDAVIRRLLIEKMRLFLARDASAAPPTEKDLQDYLERHGDRFMQPAQLSFSHLFLSATGRGDHLENDAQALLARVRAQEIDAAAAAELSDPFPLGLQIRAYSQNRIVARFGKPFAERVFNLQPGAWSGPIVSPYGLHLVRVLEHSAPRVPQLAAVRQQVEQAVLTERAAAQLARGLERLRNLYEIRVERTEDLSAPGTALAARRS